MLLIFIECFLKPIQSQLAEESCIFINHYHEKRKQIGEKSLVKKVNLYDRIIFI